MKILVIFSILATLNLYVAIRIIARCVWAKQHILVVSIITIIFLTLQLVGILGGHRLSYYLSYKFNLHNTVTAIHFVSYMAFGALSFLCVYSLAVDIIAIFWHFLAPASYPIFNRFALPIIGFATITTLILGVLQTMAGPTVKQVEIPLKNLPANFDGFKIVQISDLHVGALIRRSYVEDVVQKVNGLQPNVIAMTGDFIDGFVHDLKDDVAPLSNLQASHGKFFVTGNHEYYWGAAEWVEEFTKLGARVLSNEHVIIENEGEKIVLAGVTDYSTRGKTNQDSSDPARALAGTEQNRVKILLAHQPSSYHAANKAGADLQLSGHTHAGQYFPFTLFIRFFHTYYKGLNKHNNMWIYINRGTGYWGPPLRVGAPAEITLIVLKSSNN